MSNKDLNSAGMILGLAVIGSFAVGVGGLFTGLIGLLNGSTIEGSIGLIGSAISFGSILYFFQIKK